MMIMVSSDGVKRSSEDLVDALPYADNEYADPQLKREVELLVEEEMKQGSKRPADFLQTLPSLAPASELLKDCPMVAKAVERLRAGRPGLTALDMSRYSVQAPPVGRRNDTVEWSQVVRNAKIQLQYNTIKQENLQLMLQHSNNIWLSHNQRLEALNSRLQAISRKFTEEVEALNRDRKLNQQAAARVLSHLETQWKELCEKNNDIEVACLLLEQEVEQLRQQQPASAAEPLPGAAEAMEHQ